MKVTRLGNTDLKVSRLCLGTMTFGAQCDAKESIAILDTAAAGGINFFDTADLYPSVGSNTHEGKSEAILGGWLSRRHRDDFVVATKAGWTRGNSRAAMVAAVDASLLRLQTDYIDLFQLHRPDPATSVDETLATLHDLVEVGKVRYVGCSNFSPYQVIRALRRCERQGWQRFSAVQPRYNLICRDAERELFELCDEEQMGVLPYNPLAGGFLTGKYRVAAPPLPSTRFALDSTATLYRERYWHEAMFQAVEKIREIAASVGMSAAQVALAWVVAQPVVTAAIIGASTPAQLAETLVAGDWEIDEDVLRALDDLTAGFTTPDSEDDDSTAVVRIAGM